VHQERDGPVGQNRTGHIFLTADRHLANGLGAAELIQFFDEEISSHRLIEAKAR
jgi:hypothetical protein